AKQLPSDFTPLIWGRDQDKTQLIATNLSLPYVIADVRDYGQVQSAFAEADQILNGIDMVINCAGIWTQGHLQDHSPDLIFELMHTNAIGALWISHAAFPYLKSSANHPLLVHV